MGCSTSVEHPWVTVKGHLVLGSDETSSGHQLEELQVGGGGAQPRRFSCSWYCRHKKWPNYV